MYDNGIIASRGFDISLISVGNLAVGGTGKTPHVEYILRILDGTKTGMLSRGYKRKTKGFVLASEAPDSRSIGDEPYQIFRKNQSVVVAVDEKRVRGVSKMLALFPDLKAIVLDDAFQHRKIKAGLSVLLTDFAAPFITDFVLPGGNLRERKNGYRRADVIIVTKCPSEISSIELRLLSKTFSIFPHQSLFFSTYEYGDLIPVFTEIGSGCRELATLTEQDCEILLVTGIANTRSITEKLMTYTSKVETLKFPDHYNFQKKDYKTIEDEFNKIKIKNKVIVTTEKDAARLLSDKGFPESLKPYVFALPIKVKILNDQEQDFINKIQSYVAENSRNS